MNMKWTFVTCAFSIHHWWVYDRALTYISHFRNVCGVMSDCFDIFVFVWPLTYAKWVWIWSEVQDRAETKQQTQSIDNRCVSVTCAVWYHIRQQYDSPCSLTYYVGSHDSYTLHLSKQGPKIHWHHTHTCTQTHTYLTCSVILTTHRHWKAQMLLVTQCETLESCQSRNRINKMTGSVLMSFWGNANAGC